MTKPLTAPARITADDVRVVSDMAEIVMESYRISDGRPDEWQPAEYRDGLMLQALAKKLKVLRRAGR